RYAPLPVRTPVRGGSFLSTAARRASFSAPAFEHVGGRFADVLRSAKLHHPALEDRPQCGLESVALPPGQLAVAHPPPGRFFGKRQEVPEEWTRAAAFPRSYDERTLDTIRRHLVSALGGIGPQLAQWGVDATEIDLLPASQAIWRPVREGSKDVYMEGL